MDEVDERPRRPDRVAEVRRAGDRELLDVDDVRDEQEVDREEGEHHPVDPTPAQRNRAPGRGPVRAHSVAPLRRFRRTETPPSTLIPLTRNTGASGPADSSESGGISRPPSSAKPVSITCISGGTVISTPPSRQIALMCVSRDVSVAWRRSRSVPPSTLIASIRSGTCQAPFLEIPDRTEIRRAGRPVCVTWPAPALASALPG